MTDELYVLKLHTGGEKWQLQTEHIECVPNK